MKNGKRLRSAILNCKSTLFYSLHGWETKLSGSYLTGIMMGRQIRFYMNEGDELDFSNFLHITGKVRIYPYISKAKAYMAFKSFSELKNCGARGLPYLYRKDLSEKLFVNYVKQQGYYTIDFLNSEVIGVITCELKNNKLNMGRLHMDGEKLVNNNTELVPKSKDFVLWYEQLCKWIRKNFKKKYDGAYVGPGAAELLDKGVEFIGHDHPREVKKQK